jgi:hypothetical protein
MKKPNVIPPGKILIDYDMYNSVLLLAEFNGVEYVNYEVIQDFPLLPANKPRVTNKLRNFFHSDTILFSRKNSNVVHQAHEYVKANKHRFPEYTSEEHKQHWVGLWQVNMHANRVA